MKALRFHRKAMRVKMTAKENGAVWFWTVRRHGGFWTLTDHKGYTRVLDEHWVNSVPPFHAIAENFGFTSQLLR